MSGRAPAELMRVGVQRLVHAIPEPARALLRRILRPPGAVEPWTAPLAGGGDSISWPRAVPRTPRASVAPAASGLRCLLVTDSLDSGGVDEFVGFLVRRLPELGIVTAVMPAPSRSSRARGNALGVTARRLAAEGVEILEGGLEPNPSALTDWRPDVVAMHAGSTWAVKAAHDAGIPVVETLHGLHNLNADEEVGVLGRLELLAAVAAVSETVAQQFARVAPSATPALVIANGIDPDRVSRTDRAVARTALGVGDEPLIVSLGRYSLQKNSYALLGAFEAVTARLPQARLVVAGRVDDPSYVGRMLARRRRMRHGDRVHLRGNLTRADVLLAAADCFVLDSFFEGWALASMEALGTGIPVVTSDVGGAREQLTGGVPRGAVVAHPIGDPLTTDWDAMARARFVPQANHDELVGALVGVLDGSLPVATRNEIAEYSIDRFRDDQCLAAHARLLTAVASGDTLSPVTRPEASA